MHIGFDDADYFLKQCLHIIKVIKQVSFLGIRLVVPLLVKALYKLVNTYPCKGEVLVLCAVFPCVTAGAVK